MIAICLAPIYILLNIYILRWVIKWIGVCNKTINNKPFKIGLITVYTFFAISLVIGFLIPDNLVAKRIFTSIGYYWLGVLLYTILTIVIMDLLRFILKRKKKINQEKLTSKLTSTIVGIVCLILIVSISTYGVINARIIHTTDYNVTVNKSVDGDKELKIVLVADMHMGYSIGCKHMQNMVDKINAQDADLVVIAGDIFDNDYAGIEDPDRMSEILKSIKSKYGVYACYGNHDIQEKILAGFTFGGNKTKKMSSESMDEFVEKSNIKLLRDESVLINDEFYLYGRPDYERLGRGIDVRKTAEEITADMDKTKPIIVIDHEPRELEELSEAGVDLDLCGHTHDGQVFPGNLTINLFWENACGYLKKGEMHNIVTSGVGVFGPNMRVGTKAEICPITVTFK